MGVYDIYKSKLKTAEEAVKAVKDGDWVDYCQGLAFPIALDEALAGRKDELFDVKVRNGVGLLPSKVVLADPEMEHFTYTLWHCSGGDRKLIAEKKAYFSPMLFRYVGDYYKKGLAKVNVVMVTVAPMDEYGNFSFGLTNCCMQEIIDAADIVIVEANAKMPKVYGLEKDYINIRDVDIVVESDIDLPVIPDIPPTETDMKIAGHIMPYLKDGVTIQIGIGGTPSAVGQMISESDIKDIGMHTEQLNNGYLHLYKAGKLTNKKKEIDTGKGVFSVCAGDKELYDFIGDNLAFASAPIRYTNDPAVMAAFKDFVSINGCISVDLFGQVSSESAGLRQISGTGGQLDFVNGAFETESGYSFLTMPSTHRNKDGSVSSNVIPYFTEGDIITVPRAQASYIVTEFGVACLHGGTTWERAERLIDIAHPDFRDELIKAAEAASIWRKTNKR